MLRQARAAIVVVALLAPTALPPAASAQELDANRAQEDIRGAHDDLDDLDRAIAAARRELEAIEESLHLRTAEQTRLEEALAEAREDERAARERTRRVEARLAVLDEELDALEGRLEVHQDAVDDRAATAYKLGTPVPVGALATAILASEDLHDIAARSRALRVASAIDREVVAEARVLITSTVRVRANVTELREQRIAEQRIVRDARERAQAVADQHAALTDEVAAEHARRATVLNELEGDRNRNQALLARIYDQIEDLAAELETAMLDGAPPGWEARLPSGGLRWAGPISGAATRAGIDSRLLAAVVWTESSFREGAVSSSGAIGLAQLMPATARGLGVDPHNPTENLAGGARYLSYQLRSFGTVHLALAAYNAGPGAVRRAGGIPHVLQTQLYVLIVLDRLHGLVV